MTANSFARPAGVRRLDNFRLPRLQNRDQKAFTLYQYVAAYVSKYEISPDNRLTPMSVRTTVLSNQMAGQRLDDIVSTALFQSRTGFRAIIVPIGFNDITRGYAQYKTALATNPWAVEQQFAIRDAQRAGVVFHAH